MAKQFQIGFVFLSLSYLLIMFWTPFTGDWFFKILPLFIILYQVQQHLSGATRILAITALIFSMAGDIILNLDNFVAGLAAFLVAQIMYSVLFIRAYNSLFHRYHLSLILLAYMTFMVWLLLPRLGDMAIPVMAYLVVIGVMGFTSVMSSIKGLVAGALIFILSDSLIAMSQFVAVVPAGGWWVMITYYAAQFLIHNSLIRHYNKN